MVSLIVVNYNTELYVKDIEYACSHNELVELIVVDNSSSYHGSGYARTIREGNLGYGCAINRGVSLSLYENILILNPDILLDSITLDLIIRECEKRSYECCTFGLLNMDRTIQYGHSRLLNRKNTILTSSGLLRLAGIERKRYMKLRDSMVIEQPLGGCFLIKRNVFYSISGFCEKFFVFWEDVDFFWRMRETGISPILINHIKLIHAGGGSFDENMDWKKQLLELQGRIIYFKERGWVRPQIGYRLIELMAWVVKKRFVISNGSFIKYFRILLNWSADV